MRKVILIAFHFPPLIGSSGIQRTLGFARHLEKYGWEPIILTAHPRVYPNVNYQANTGLPEHLVVKRAFALDTAKHLAIKGRYPQSLALPDRWMSWRWGAVPAGMKLIQEHRPQAIWSTYPIASAHLIGATLAKRSGLPWIADFRDPMAQEGYPANPRAWQSFKDVEEQIFSTARYATFTTSGAQRMYQDRYPNAACTPEQMIVIENGFDDDAFKDLTPQKLPSDGPLVLLHSGIVYPSERDPRAFFDALKQLVDEKAIGIDRLKLRFRASVHDEFIMSCAQERGIAHLIELAPAISYREALNEMMSVHGLLVLQANNCNDQIPAKSYEYLRAQRPLLILADPAGDTGKLFSRIPGIPVAALESKEHIAQALRQFLAALINGTAQIPSLETAQQYNRQTQTGELAKLLDHTQNS